MPERQLQKFAQQSEKIQSLLNALVSRDTSVEDYRSVMRCLGSELAGNILSSGTLPSDHDIRIVCTVEDADFLVQGMIDVFAKESPFQDVYLSCLWNERVKQEGFSFSPILKAYEERIDVSGRSKKTSFLVVKSIISGACVVKTNLLRALSSAENCENILIVSPVLLDGAQSRLQEEFPLEIAKKFKYFWFATDYQKDGDDVLPGIGGSVYERLGFCNEKEKNKYIPEIVKIRRNKSTSTQLLSV